MIDRHKGICAAIRYLVKRKLVKVPSQEWDAIKHMIQKACAIGPRG